MHPLAFLYFLFSFSTCVEFFTKFYTAGKDARNYNRRKKLPLSSTSYDSAGERRAPLDNASGDTNGQCSKGCRVASDSHIAIEKSWKKMESGGRGLGEWIGTFIS